MAANGRSLSDFLPLRHDEVTLLANAKLGISTELGDTRPFAPSGRRRSSRRHEAFDCHAFV